MRSLILFSLLVLAAEPVFSQSSTAGGEKQHATAPSLEANVELARVRGLLDQSKLDEAESAVRRYTEQHPHKSDGYFLLGLTLFRRVQSMAKSSGTFLAPGEVPSTALNPKKRDATICEWHGAFLRRPEPHSGCNQLATECDFLARRQPKTEPRTIY